MRLHKTRFTGMLLVVATAIAALAPMASADDDRDDRDRRDGQRYESRRDRDDDRRGNVRRGREYDQRAQATVRWAYKAFGGRDGRSYFYREVSTGRVHSHITFFRPDHSGRGHGPVERIDKRSGRVLNAYIWDGNSWDECSRADYARYEGRGRRHSQYAYHDGYRR